MGYQAQRDFIEMTIASPPSGTGGASLTVQTGQGNAQVAESLVGSSHYFMTLVNAAGVRETVKVTARTNDAFTIERAQNNTAAYGSWQVGDKVYVGVGRQELLGLTRDSGASALGSIGGTGNAITAAAAPAVTALSPFSRFIFIATAANTGATTINIDGTGVKAITREGATALTGGEIQSGAVIEIVYDGTQFQLVGAVGSSTAVPVGFIGDTAAASAPAGWLLCGGQAVSRTTYAALFAAIGTTYGVGDGSTTFNVPDCRGRVRAGKDNMGGSAANRITAAVSGINGATLGAAGGDERMHLHSHSGVADAGGAHLHTGTTNFDGNHSHSFNGGQGVPISTGQQAGQEGAIQTITGYGLIYATDVGGGHTHGFTTSMAAAHGHDLTIGNAGLGNSQNVQPTIVFNTIIKY